jgi:CO/xanthine dehydrogenase Mo-binding subunit
LLYNITVSETIGAPVDRQDAPDKIGGRARYTADLAFEGLLHAATLRSTAPHANILSIRAPRLPPGYFVVDRRDVPGRNRVKMIADDQPFFAEERARYVGEPILLVAGPDREVVARIVASIEVEYEPLAPVLGIEEADSLGNGHRFVEYTIRKGDPEKAFAAASRVFEGEYRTGLQEHAYLEPQGVVAVCEGGRMTVYGSLQCPYYVKGALVQGLGWGEDRVRVVQAATGGAFGGKEDYPSILAGQAAFAALKTGKPVRLVLGREEDMRCTTKRHPSLVRVRTALDRTGTVSGAEVSIRLDGGAYEGLSSVVLQRAMFHSTGVYRFDHVRVDGRVLRTNTVPTGAFRGFGTPQAVFAIEMHMHSLAETLGEDPVDFKLRHLLRTGDTTVTGGALRERVMMPEIAQKALEMSGYRRKAGSYRSRGRGTGSAARSTGSAPAEGAADAAPGEIPARAPAGGPLRGVGVSLFNHGCAFTGSGERDRIKAKVKLRKRADGTVEILTASAEFGQGPSTTLRSITARALGVPLSTVVWENPDTDRAPDSGPTVASRTVLIVGKLLERAALALRGRWDSAPEVETGAEYEQPGYVRWDQSTFEGNAYPVYSWGANVVEVEVDPLTCEVEVKGIWGVYDVGRAVDERILRGQVAGGVAQGLGWGAMEVMGLDRGEVRHASLGEYVVPTSLDFPPVECAFVDNPFEDGPFGAKGAGELPFVGAAPAYAAAVQSAVGAPLRRLPVTPEYLREVAGGGSSAARQR